MIEVNGHRMPLPGRESAITAKYYQKLQATFGTGLDGRGRTRLLRIEKALRAYVTKVDVRAKSGQPVSTDEMHIDDLRRTRLSQFASDALMQITGLREQLDSLVDSHAGLQLYYRGVEMSRKRDGSYERCFDEFYRSQEQLDPNVVKSYLLILQGLRSGLILSQMAIWKYTPGAHMESLEKRKQSRGGAKSAFLNADQRDAARKRFSEMSVDMGDATQEALYRQILKELTDSKSLYAGATIRKIPTLNTLKRILNREPEDRNPEDDLFKALSVRI
jgi:hypothetical protein